MFGSDGEELTDTANENEREREVKERTHRTIIDLLIGRANAKLLNGKTQLAMKYTISLL